MRKFKLPIQEEISKDLIIELIKEHSEEKARILNLKEYYKNSGAILRRFLSKSHNRFIAYIIAFYDKIKPDLLRLAIMCGAIICGYLLLWATGILFEFKLLMSGYVALYIVEGIDNDITEFNARMKKTLDDNNK